MPKIQGKLDPDVKACSSEIFSHYELIYRYTVYYEILLWHTAYYDMLHITILSLSLYTANYKIYAWHYDILRITIYCLSPYTAYYDIIDSRIYF